MNAIVLGMAILVSSTAVSPTLETSRDTVMPTAFTFDLPDGVAKSRNPPNHLLSEQSRPVWRRASFQTAPATTAKRFTSACGGFLPGGAIGYAATSTRNPDDDVSGLRGMVIGAPVGAVISAAVAYRLSKKVGLNAVVRGTGPKQAVLTSASSVHSRSFADNCSRRPTLRSPL